MAKDEPRETATVERPRLWVPDDAARFVLEAIEGPIVGARFVVDEQEPLPLLVGSSPVCAVRLHDPEVSRRHATLDIVDRGLRLTDLSSTNGTSVDGVLVLQASVRPGQTVRVGQTALKVTRDSASPLAEVARTNFGRVFGASAEMRRLFPAFGRLAAATLPLIIEGETGTGKELLAESLHEQGPRRSGPFVVLDCATLTPEDFEGEVFGDATSSGVFERASGGTLLLDQIDQLEPSLQQRLLRVLDRPELTPLGGGAGTVDVRIVAATAKDLDQEIQSGRFREDLFHRIAVARVELPPLRRRGGDVAFLAAHFLRELGGERPLEPRTLSAWVDDTWPGNVRQLRNAVARQITLGDEAARATQPGGSAVGVRTRFEDELTNMVKEAITAGMPLASGREEVVELYERAYVRAVLVHHEGSIGRAIATAGISRRYFEVLRARQKSKR